MPSLLTPLDLKEFNLLQDLGAVLRRHNARILYTNDDDGVHLEIDGVILPTGYWDADDMTARTIELAQKTYGL